MRLYVSTRAKVKRGLLSPATFDARYFGGSLISLILALNLASLSNRGRVKYVYRTEMQLHGVS